MLNPRGSSVLFSKIITQSPFKLDICVEADSLTKSCRSLSIVPEKFNLVSTLASQNWSENTDGSCKMAWNLDNSKGHVWTADVIGKAKSSATV